jgi:hypothetical protein
MKLQTRFIYGLLFIGSTAAQICDNFGCVTFSIAAGTGCAWMCNYCANALGTNNYYFTDGICTYQSGGCVGNPELGISYTCCAV